jgi:hypothetical protein
LYNNRVFFSRSLWIFSLYSRVRARIKLLIYVKCQCYNIRCDNTIPSIFRDTSCTAHIPSMHEEQFRRKVTGVFVTSTWHSTNIKNMSSLPVATGWRVYAALSCQVCDGKRVTTFWTLTSLWYNYDNSVAFPSRATAFSADMLTFTLHRTIFLRILGCIANMRRGNYANNL